MPSSNTNREQSDKGMQEKLVGPDRAPNVSVDTKLSECLI